MIIASEASETLSSWLAGAQASPLAVKELYAKFDDVNSEGFYIVQIGDGEKKHPMFAYGSSQCCASGTCDTDICGGLS